MRDAEGGRDVTTRRDFLRRGAAVASGFAALSLIGCGDDDADDGRTGADDSRKVQFQQSFINDVGLAGIFYAQESGLFRDVGLDVEALPGGAGIDPVVIVASGQAFMGNTTNAASVIIPRSRGVPVKVVAAQYKRSPLGFLAKRETGVESIEDIRGKKVGVVQTSVSVLESVLKINGMTGSVQPVVVAPASTLSALLDGTVDVQVAFSLNQKLQMDLRGIDNTFLSFFDLGFKQESYPYFASEDTIKNDPELVAGFVSAARKGWGYALDHPEEVAKLTVEEYMEGGDLAQQTEYARRQREIIDTPFTEKNGLLYPDLATWEVTNKVLLDTGLIEKSVDLQQLLTFEFV